MRITILYGTESGNTEMVADDIAAALNGETAVVDMQDFDVADFDPATVYLVLSSTYGEGELPVGAQPFFAALERERPDLAGIRYAVFGLGDSSYDQTYSRGGEILDEALARLGARRFGEFGRHDAAGRIDASEAGIEWAEGAIEIAASDLEAVAA